MANLFVARQSGTVMVDGRRHSVRRGVTIAEEGADIIARDPRMWQPLRVHYPAKPGRSRRAVETTTAAPGEQRVVQLPTPGESLACDHPGCDATAKTAQGLSAHKRTHA